MYNKEPVNKADVYLSTNIAMHSPSWYTTPIVGVCHAFAMHNPTYTIFTNLGGLSPPYQNIYCVRSILMRRMGSVHNNGSPEQVINVSKKPIKKPLIERMEREKKCPQRQT